MCATFPETQRNVVERLGRGDASNDGVGDDHRVRTNLENAELGSATTDPTIDQAASAPRLAAFHDCLENDEKANERKAFAQRLECPRATEDSFRRLTVRMLDPRSRLGRVAVLQTGALDTGRNRRFDANSVDKPSPIRQVTLG